MKRPGRTEGDDIVSPGASENTGRIIVCVAIRRRTNLLELLRVIRRLTNHRIPVDAPTTVLVRIKHVTRTTARHRLSADFQGELRRAGGPQVTVASGDTAIPLPVNWGDGHWQVESVDEADVVKI